MQNQSNARSNAIQRILFKHTKGNAGRWIIIDQKLKVNLFDSLDSLLSYEEEMELNHTYVFQFPLEK